MQLSWVQFNVPLGTVWIGPFLQVWWPNQQCQSAEGRQTKKTINTHTHTHIQKTENPVVYNNTMGWRGDGFHRERVAKPERRLDCCHGTSKHNWEKGHRTRVVLFCCICVCFFQTQLGKQRKYSRMKLPWLAFDDTTRKWDGLILRVWAPPDTI